MSVFEAGMMVCFGISWPVAALKTYRCKCVHGKSIHFSMLIFRKISKIRVNTKIERHSRRERAAISCDSERERAGSACNIHLI